jgi:hypothetical protein
MGAVQTRKCPHYERTKDGAQVTRLLKGLLWFASCWVYFGVLFALDAVRAGEKRDHFRRRMAGASEPVKREQERTERVRSAVEGGWWRRESPGRLGKWAHGAKGIFQFYRELLNAPDLRVITTYLDYLTAKKVKGHWPCPCGSGMKLRDCHFSRIQDLREKISRKDAERSLATLKAAGASAIEMTEAKSPIPINQS